MFSFWTPFLPSSVVWSNSSSFIYYCSIACNVKSRIRYLWDIAWSGSLKTAIIFYLPDEIFLITSFIRAYPICNTLFLVDIAWPNLINGQTLIWINLIIVILHTITDYKLKLYLLNKFSHRQLHFNLGTCFEETLFIRYVHATKLMQMGNDNAGVAACVRDPRRTIPGCFFYV